MRKNRGDADFGVEGGRNEDTARQILAQVDQRIADATGPSVDTATPATPFITAQKPGRLGIRDEMAFNIPANARKIWVTIVETANPNKKLRDAINDITQAERDARYLRRVFDADLKPNTEYGLYLVETSDIFGDTSQLPAHDPDPGAYLVTWTTSDVFDVAPGTPDATDILLNQPYLGDGVNGNAEFEYRLWVDQAHVQTAGSLDLDDAFVSLVPSPFTDDTKAEHYHAAFTEEGVIESGHALKVRAILPLGTYYEVRSATIRYAAGKRKSALAATPVRFYAGGKTAQADADIPEPTFPAVQLLDAHNTRITERIVNPDGVLLKNNNIEISYDAQATWEEVLVENVRQQEDLDSPGTHDLIRVIQHKRNRQAATWYLRATLSGIGKISGHSPKKTTTVAHYLSFVPPLDDVSVPQTLNTPVIQPKPYGLHIKSVRATVATDTLQYNEIVIKCVDNSGTLIGYLDTTTNTLTASEATAKLNIGDAATKSIIISNAQLISAFGGPSNRNLRVYFYATNLVGTSAASPDSASLAFSSLNADPQAADASVPTSLATPTIHAKQQGIQIKGCRAAANDTQEQFKELVIKCVDNSGTLIGYLDTTTNTLTASEATARLNIGNAASKTLIITAAQLIAAFGGPANRNLRAYYYATNLVGTSAASSDSSSLAFSSLSTDFVVQDTAVPTLATNPETGTTGPTVQDWFGTIAVSAVAPSANLNTLDRFQFIESTSNTAPAGSPTVGSEGVVKIKEGPSSAETFRVKQAQIGQTFYFYFRAHNQFGAGYSVWSAGTSIVPSRPLQDVIGDALPTMPEGLARAATAPSSPAVANDATHFSIDTPASSETDFYKNMVLYIPSLPATDQMRWTTGYDAANHRLTVDIAFGATPGNSLDFRLYRIIYQQAGVNNDYAGRTASSGHTTTSVRLDTSDPRLSGFADDYFKGYSFIIPTQATGDQIRKVTAYNHTTGDLTIDSGISGAFGAAPSGRVPILLVNGSIGWQNPNETGIFAPVPFRHWLDGENNKTRLEGLPPTGQNAFSLTAFQFQVRRSNVAGDLRLDSQPQSIATGFGWSYDAPTSYGPVVSLRVRNLFRGDSVTPVDGWSGFTYHVRAQKAVGASGVANYNPNAFPAPIIDYQGPDSYPDSRYPVY